MQKDNFHLSEAENRARHAVGGTQVQTLDDVLALPRFLKRYPDLLSENQLRWLYFHRDSNGLAKSGAVTKCGGRLFVVVPRMRNYLLGGSYEK